jgi:hypothetical protein
VTLLCATGSATMCVDVTQPNAFDVAFGTHLVVGPRSCFSNGHGGQQCYNHGANAVIVLAIDFARP